MRPVSSRTRSSACSAQRALELEVRARLARRVGVGGHARAHAPVAADRRVDRARCAPAGGPRRARGTRARSRAARARLQRARGPPRSGRRRAGRRCRGRGGGRCPARSGSGPPATRPASSCDERARRVPARRVHDDAGAACRPRAGARPRRRSVKARGARAGAAARASGSATLDRLAGQRRGGSWAGRRRRRVTSAGVDQPLGLRARAQRLGQERVEPLARRLGATSDARASRVFAACSARASST